MVNNSSYTKLERLRRFITKTCRFKHINDNSDVLLFYSAVSSSVRSPVSVMLLPAASAGKHDSDEERRQHIRASCRAQGRLQLLRPLLPDSVTGSSPRLKQRGDVTVAAAGPAGQRAAKAGTPSPHDGVKEPQLRPSRSGSPPAAEAPGVGVFPPRGLKRSRAPQDVDLTPHGGGGGGGAAALVQILCCSRAAAALISCTVITFTLLALDRREASRTTSLSSTGLGTTWPPVRRSDSSSRPAGNMKSHRKSEGHGGAEEPGFFCLGLRGAFIVLKKVGLKLRKN
ncbi:hypothetical protein INR49_022639 [Caranx melampygus]|nr:hypothetical protein INR49_022639 [Caranx melampygus]